MLASSVLAIGVKVPVQVMLSVLVITASVPLATVMSAELEKEATASEKTSVTVAVSPVMSAVSERVKELTEGAVVSVVEELSVVSGIISSLLEHEETSTAMLTIRINQDNKLFTLFFFRRC